MRLNGTLFLSISLQCIWESDSFISETVGQSKYRSFSIKSSIFDEFEEFSSDNGSSSKSDQDIYAALRARQASLGSSLNFEGPTSSETLDEEDPLAANWRQAACESTVRLSLPDWIRRMAIDTYPLAVCGSAGGNLYLADLQRGEELDCLEGLHDAQVSSNSPQNIDDALEYLYGEMDGGGVISIAMKDDLIVSSGREGGIQVCVISGQEEDVYKGSRGGTTKQTKLSIERSGKIRGLELDDSVLITSFAFDNIGTLWAGGYDGILRGYDYTEKDSEGRPLMLRQKSPLHEIYCKSGILSVSVNDEIGCGVVSTVSEGVILFSLEDGEIIGQWKPFVSKIRKEYPRSAFIVQNDKDTTFGPANDNWSLVVGGSRGSVFLRRLNVDGTGYVSDSRPFLDETKRGADFMPMKLRPPHLGAVMSLASPGPGLFVTGSQDGSMRVWDCSTSAERELFDDDDDDEDEAQYDDVEMNDIRPKCLYALSGYKVWLGSIFANRNKLVSDGADNTIVVHSFDGDDDDVLFREDDEDELEGFSFE